MKTEKARPIIHRQVLVYQHSTCHSHINKIVKTLANNAVIDNYYSHILGKYVVRWLCKTYSCEGS